MSITNMIKYDEYSESNLKEIIRKSNLVYSYNQCVCLLSDNLHRRRLPLSLSQSGWVWDSGEWETDPYLGSSNTSDQIAS